MNEVSGIVSARCRHSYRFKKFTIKTQRALKQLKSIGMQCHAPTCRNNFNYMNNLPISYETLAAHVLIIITSIMYTGNTALVGSLG